MAEITEQGFVLKTQNEYFQEETAFYLGIDSGWNLDPSTPDGLKMAKDSETFGNLDETLQGAYNSKDPDKARDLELDIIGALTGSIRAQGTASTVTLRLTGVPATFIEKGSLVGANANDIVWSLDADVTLPPAGIIDTSFTATTRGPNQADVGTLTRIITTTGGWQESTNLTVAVAGTAPETNGQFRLRRARSVSAPGSNQVDSLTGSLFGVDNVRRVRVYENDTASTDANGLPQHSTASVVDGGSDDDIALAIYLKKNPGHTLHPAGTPVVVNVSSPDFPQNNKDITFSRPIYIDVTVVVSVVDDGTLPANADELIEAAILEYVQGSLLQAGQGFNTAGFDIGEDVPASRLYTPVNSVIGQFGNSYISSITVDGSQNVAIAFNELSRWSNDEISVVIS